MVMRTCVTVCSAAVRAVGFLVDAGLPLVQLARDDCQGQRWRLIPHLLLSHGLCFYAAPPPFETDWDASDGEEVVAAAAASYSGRGKFSPSDIYSIDAHLRSRLAEQEPCRRNSEAHEA